MISQEFITQNFPQGEVTIVGGHPAIGKSSLATSLALSLANIGKKSIFFSLEMSKEQLIKRMKKQVGDEYYASNDAKIIINDTPSTKLSEIQEQLYQEAQSDFRTHAGCRMRIPLRWRKGTLHS